MLDGCRKLADSIMAYNVRKEPILLRLNSDGKYIVLRGHRRYNSLMTMRRPWYRRVLAWLLYR